MTNINEILLRETRSGLSKYDCWQDEIEVFLRHRGKFLERQRKAIDIIEKVMTAHGKRDLLQYVSELARVEHGIRELQPWVRDHVVHALLSFILGIYINENFLEPIFHIRVNDFQWKIAGMFHDVGYPLEIANNVMQPFTSKINYIKRKIGVDRPDIISKIDPGELEILQNDVSSFDLIQKRLEDWGLQIDAKKEYERNMASGKIDHGIISSLSVLYVIDILYEKHNQERLFEDKFVPGTNIDFNQKYFEGDVVSACTAIYIHNLPVQSFSSSKIDRSKSPVIFLLKLSDCLQQWERPSKTNPTGYSATLFDIDIDNQEIIFASHIPDHRKQKIKDEIASCLVASDIRVL